MLFPPLFVIVTSSLSKLMLAVTFWFVGFVVLYVIVPTGIFLSIQSTLASLLPLFPALSIYSNVYSPFSVNVCVFPPSTVTFSLLKLMLAITSWFVSSFILYEIVAFKSSLSIQVTFASLLPVLPALSLYSNINSLFSVNV